MARPVLFDTNIVIDVLNRQLPAYDAIRSLSDGVASISRISWIEVMSGGAPELLGATEAYLRGCNVLEVTAQIAARAAEVRRRSRLKLADAVIWATADLAGRDLVTRDIDDFPAHWPGIVHLYSL